jgi:predicted enzyme related to lactoylglutathione lyase
MALIDGIGGVFIYSSDPAKLAKWYETHLGIQSTENPDDGTFYYEFVHRCLDDPDQKARTVWAILRAKENSKGVKTRQFQINYRLADLDQLVQHLKRRGVEFEKIDEYDYGRFAWIKDPDGNRIELFEEKKVL